MIDILLVLSFSLGLVLGFLFAAILFKLSAFESWEESD